jgi:hypothetical protein
MLVNSARVIIVIVACVVHVIAGVSL